MTNVRSEISARLASAALVIFSGVAEAQDVSGVDQAAAYAKTVLGEQCDMNGMTDVTVNPPEPEGIGHYTYSISYRYSYMSSEEANQKAELYQIFCGSGAYNVSHAFVLKSGEPATLQLVSFPQPSMTFDYADEEQARLKSPPVVVGYNARLTLVNSSYDPKTQTITSHAAWRGIGDAWESGQWVFADGSFVLKRFEVDPTFDGGQESTAPESYVVFQAP